MGTSYRFCCCLIVIAISFMFREVKGQNVGIGTTSPTDKLSVDGNILARVSSDKSLSMPDGAHTFSIGSTPVQFQLVDSVYRILDPGGAGNYSPNSSNEVYLLDANYGGTPPAKFVEIQFELIDLGSNDSLYVIDPFSGTIFLRCGSNCNGQTPSFTGITLRVIFNSDLDPSVGQGFSALVRKLYPKQSTSGSASNIGISNLFFDAGSGSLRGGIGNTTEGSTGGISLGMGNQVKGLSAVAIGYGGRATNYSTISLGGGYATGNASTAIRGEATGIESVAIGHYTSSQGNNSIVLGNLSVAAGTNAVSVGYTSNAGGMNSLGMMGGNAGGENSIAIGKTTQASNASSIAIGEDVFANGSSTIAIGTDVSGADESILIGKGVNANTGSRNIVIGRNSSTVNSVSSIAIGTNVGVNGTNAMAIGYQLQSNGDYSATIGNNSSASGTGAMSLGSNVTAVGNYSVAMGSYVSTSGFTGAFTIGDRSTTTVMQTFVDNGFRSRFANGYRLFTNSATTIGAFLNANANSWAALSDVRMKENFLPVNGEVVLKKIACMPQYTWNYKGQDVKTLRHYGPMAQDFFSAFGKDDLGLIGCDTLINQQDFLGINFIAIQALEKRSSELSKENVQLKKAVQTLEERLEALEILIQRKSFAKE